jgi:hypothetical protein
MTGFAFADAIRLAGPDPLAVLASTARVMTGARDVTIDREAIVGLADTLAAQDTVAPAWDAGLHYRAEGPDGDERTAMWILVLDALNFCFWGQGSNPQERWRVRWGDEEVDGYVALVAALNRGVQDGLPLHDATWLASVDATTVAHLLQPAPGHPAIPLFDARVRNVRELGAGLLALGSQAPATTLIERAEGSAIGLVREIVRRFASFNDVATWQGHEVRFYKRAQILAGDLAGALEGSPLGRFRDLHQLTAFADYKVPQVLRQLGILRYSDELAARIARREIIPAGSRAEIEIRAATVWGCELLRQALATRGRHIAAHELDWLLWTEGQALPTQAEPYHRTPTVFY